MSNHYRFLGKEENVQKLLDLFKGFGIQHKITEDRGHCATVHFCWQWNDQYRIQLQWDRNYHSDTDEEEDTSLSYWDGEIIHIDMATKLATTSEQSLNERIVAELSILFAATKRKVRQQLYEHLSESLPMDIEEETYTQLMEVFIEAYQIIQLTNTKALREEGLNMHHCVGSYGFYCKNGTISIWSLRQQQQQTSWKSLVTIEVNSQQEVVQARGKYNSIPHPRQLLMIKEWAAQEQLHWAIITH